ncbi:Glycine dehydrogenase [compost metagenome]
MVEPTESESKRELDRFVEAMTAIRAEIARVQDGHWSLTDNPLVNAPHTQDDVMDEQWSRGYTRAEAVFPSDAVRASKLWPSVNRIDDVYGDRNLFCSCVPTEDYAGE